MTCSPEEKKEKRKGREEKDEEASRGRRRQQEEAQKVLNGHKLKKAMGKKSGSVIEK